VTDLAVSDRSSEPTPAQEVVPGDEVRELVARKERDIEALRLELQGALQEAAEAELQLAQHPDASEPAGAAEEPSTAPAPRTTVVTRLPVAAPETRPASGRGPAHRRSTAAATAADEQLGWLRFFRSHLIVKLGIALTVLALLLLFFA
jgi:hypothetical protein